MTVSSQPFPFNLLEYFEMNFKDGLNYILFQNPVSSVVIDTVKKSCSTTLVAPPKLPALNMETLVHSGHPFIRLAGVSGAAAVVLGAYGAHTFYTKVGNEEKKTIYQTANTYHFMHSLALLGVPLCRYPKVAGSLITAGMLFFCGTCYYDAFTGRSDLRKFTPIGGTFLIFGWLSLLF